MLKSCALALSAAALVVGSPALADPAPSAALDAPATAATVIAVSYADLNVSTQDGAGELFNRVNAAAKRVCAASRYPIRVDRRALYEACVRDSARDALRRVDGARSIVQVRQTTTTGSP